MKLSFFWVKSVSPTLISEFVLTVVVCHLNVFFEEGISINSLTLGHTSQVYAIRQALAKAIVAFYQKFVDEAAKKEIKEILVQYDRTLLVADPRRCEPKKVRKKSICTFLNVFTYLYISFIVRWSRCSCPFPKVLPLKKLYMFFHNMRYGGCFCILYYSFFKNNLVDFFSK